MESVYDVDRPLHVKSDDKKTWKRFDCQLSRSCGLCCRLTSPGGAGGGARPARQTATTSSSSSSSSNTEMTRCVQSLHDVDIYLASVDWRKKYKSPTQHGIALKVTLSTSTHTHTHTHFTTFIHTALRATPRRATPPYGAAVQRIRTTPQRNAMHRI